MARLEADQRLPAVWNHIHVSGSHTLRSSEERAWLEYGAEIDLVVCSSGECGAPADPGVSSWTRWAREHGFHVPAGPKLRSDEELAAVAIGRVIPQAQVDKLAETGPGRTADFAVTLADGRRAAVEATMHTDGGRRQVSAVRYRSRDAGLKHDWYVLAQDQRFLSDYDGEHSFPVMQVGELLTAALAEREREPGDLDDLDLVAARCEHALDRQWRWARNELLVRLVPLSLTIRRRAPKEGGGGNVDLTVSTAVHHFSRVTDVSALTAAVQRCIDDKLAKNQWGDTEDPKWLVVVLDEGEAATQLLGVTEFDDELLDFGAITFDGLDEVWAVAFQDGTITVLRCAKSDRPWCLHRRLTIDVGRDPDR